jgi:hypothetical protein
MDSLSTEILRSLPSFWKDNFDGKGLLEGLYNGASSLSSELYIRSMAAVTNTSLISCVTEYSPDLRVIPITSSQVIDTGGGKWICNVSADISNIRVLSPSYTKLSTVLEPGTNKDYKLYAAGEHSLISLYTRISGYLPVLEFNDNPFSWGDTGGSIPGCLVTTQVVDGPFFIKKPIYDSSVYTDAVASGYIYIKNGNTVTKHTIALSLGTEQDSLEAGIYLYTSTPAPYQGALLVSDTADGFDTYGDYVELNCSNIEVPSDTLYLVARKPDISRYYLYDMYGCIFGDPVTPSTEAYRRSLKARMMLRTLPYVKRTLDSVIAIMLGIPVILDYDEIALEVTDLGDNSTKLDTTSTSYILDSGTLNSEIQDAVDATVSPAEFLLKNTPLTLAYTVSSIYTDNDDWWKGSDISVPQELMPKATGLRLRVGDGSTYDNKFDNAADGACIGDYCIVIGEPTRQKVAFRAVQDFYKQRMIVIELSTPTDYGELSGSDKDLIVAAAPTDMLVIFKD